MKLYVKKIWSQSPTKYKYISLEEAQKEYNLWLYHITDIITYGTDMQDYFKTFDQWLKTEI